MNEQEIHEIIEIGYPNSTIQRKFALKSEEILTKDLIQELWTEIQKLHEIINNENTRND